MAAIFPVCLALIALGIQFNWRRYEAGPETRRNQMLFFAAAAAAVYLALDIAASWRLWINWETGPLTKYFLPPYRSPAYFSEYVLSRFFLPTIAAIAAAILGLYAARILNRRFGERFFEPEEPFMFAAGIFISGYPGFLIYAVFLLLAGLILAAVFVFRGRGRAPLYYLWLPAALLAILITQFLIPAEILARFGF